MQRQPFTRWCFPRSRRGRLSVNPLLDMFFCDGVSRQLPRRLLLGINPSVLEKRCRSSLAYCDSLIRVDDGLLWPPNCNQKSSMQSRRALYPLVFRQGLMSERFRRQQSLSPRSRLREVSLLETPLQSRPPPQCVRGSIGRDELTGVWQMVLQSGATIVAGRLRASKASHQCRLVPGLCLQ